MPSSLLQRQKYGVDSAILSGRCFLLLLNELALDEDLDLVADEPLAIEHHIERQAKFLAVDLGLGAIGDAVAHHRVIELSVLHNRKRNWPGIALDGHVTGHIVGLWSSLFNLGAFEVHRWILVNFQKI